MSTLCDSQEDLFKITDFGLERNYIPEATDLCVHRLEHFYFLQEVFEQCLPTALAHLVWQ